MLQHRAARLFRPVSASVLARAAMPSQGVFAHARAFASIGDTTGYKSKILAVLGAQWGDEGKGKLVDILAKKYDIIARFNGGANAGHTLVVDGKKFAFHLLPCGMLYKDKINVIGNGVVLHVPTMLKELQNLHDAGISTDGRLKISDRTHLLVDAHQKIDGALEAKRAAQSIGTTKRGIGPCYSSKTTRHGLRVGDLLHWRSFEQRYNSLIDDLQSMYDFEYDKAEELERFRKYREIIAPMVVDTIPYINAALAQGKTVLAEGANAALLDIDFGTYPYVTSSSTAAGGICTGLGIPPTKIDTTVGIVKAYTTRVGEGPFPTLLTDEVGKHMGKVGHEFGTTTGRPRKCGWLDIPVVQYSHALNDYSFVNITKLDVLTGLKELKIGVAYEFKGKRLAPGHMPAHLDDLSACKVIYETMPGWTEDISKATSIDELPVNARNYVKRVEQLLGVPVSWVGVGPGRLQMATNFEQPK